MPTEARLLRLLTWLSPAFPVGAFGYPHGLETAVRDGAVSDATTLPAWIAGLIEHGSGWTDAVLAAPPGPPSPPRTTPRSTRSPNWARRWRPPRTPPRDDGPGRGAS